MTAEFRYHAPTLPHPADHLVCEKPLGALYKAEKTVFRVWAPTATKLTLNLYHAPTGGHAQPVPMAQNEDGSWEITLAGDCLGLYYTYSAAGEDAQWAQYQRAVACNYSSDDKAALLEHVFMIKGAKRRPHALRDACPYARPCRHAERRACL